MCLRMVQFFGVIVNSCNSFSISDVVAESLSRTSEHVFTFKVGPKWFSQHKRIVVSVCQEKLWEDIDSETVEFYNDLKVKNERVKKEEKERKTPPQDV